MRRLKSSLLVILLALPGVAQTAAEKPGFDVRRVAHRLACQCGCKDSVATCAMLDCSFSKPAKERIARMLAGGMSGDAIVDVFVKEYGAKVYLAEPSPFGWIVPYLSIGAGLVVIRLFIRRYRRAPAEPVAAAGVTVLDRYRDQIERDLTRLD